MSYCSLHYSFLVVMANVRVTISKYFTKLFIWILWSALFFFCNLRLLSKKAKYNFVRYVSGHPVVSTLQARQFVCDCRQVHRPLVFVTESRPAQRHIQCSFHLARESDSWRGKESWSRNLRIQFRLTPGLKVPKNIRSSPCTSSFYIA